MQKHAVYDSFKQPASESLNWIIYQHTGSLCLVAPPTSRIIRPIVFIIEYAVIAHFKNSPCYFISSLTARFRPLISAVVHF